VAVQLKDKSSVWLLASTPLDKETKESLKGLGDVKWIIAPDVVHHLYVSDVSNVTSIPN